MSDYFLSLAGPQFLVAYGTLFFLLAWTIRLLRPRFGGFPLTASTCGGYAFVAWIRYRSELALGHEDFGGLLLMAIIGTLILLFLATASLRRSDGSTGGWGSCTSGCGMGCGAGSGCGGGGGCGGCGGCGG